MIFFGWGKRSKSWALTDGSYILATWSYFDIFWIPIASGIKWHLIGDSRSADQEITLNEARKITGIPSLHIGYFSRFGLLVIPAIFIVLWVWALIFPNA